MGFSRKSYEKRSKTGKKSQKGYGKAKEGGRINVKAERVAYKAFLKGFKQVA